MTKVPCDAVRESALFLGKNLRPRFGRITMLLYPNYHASLKGEEGRKEEDSLSESGCILN